MHLSIVRIVSSSLISHCSLLVVSIGLMANGSQSFLSTFFFLFDFQKNSFFDLSFLVLFVYTKPKQMWGRPMDWIWDETNNFTFTQAIHRHAPFDFRCTNEMSFDYACSMFTYRLALAMCCASLCVYVIRKRVRKLISHSLFISFLTEEIA